MTKKILILDYGSGNVQSVFNICNFLEKNTIISNDINDIKNCTHIILPGVGSYDSAIKKIRLNLPLDIIYDQIINHKKPFLGICVGMQVLSDYGFEFKESKGLGLIQGSVKLLKTKNLPLPNIGWCEITIEKKNPLFKDIDNSDSFYFVHSYHFEVDNPEDIIATTHYDTKFVSAIQRGNIFGVQFHPEKSQRSGIKIINNFLEI